jgi:hypothetical protein
MGISFGGLLKSVMNPMSLAQLAMGPAGWASLAMKAIGSQIAMQLIQKLGQQMGLPPAMIDLAQAAFASASGQPGLAKQNIGEAVRGFTQQMDLRPSDAGRLERELNGMADKSLDSMSKLVDDFMEKLANKKPKGPGEDEEVGGSWLVAFAKAMGKVLDKKALQIQTQSDKVVAATKKQEGVSTESEEYKKAQSEMMGANTLLQGLSQEMNILSNAATTVIKTVGEAQTTIARK